MGHSSHSPLESLSGRERERESSCLRYDNARVLTSRFDFGGTVLFLCMDAADRHAVMTEQEERKAKDKRLTFGAI